MREYRRAAGYRSQHAEEPVLASARVFFLMEVTHDGLTVVDHCPCVPVWRAAPLGLSLVWLSALGPRRGTGAYPRRTASHRPTLTGTDRRQTVAARDCRIGTRHGAAQPPVVTARAATSGHAKENSNEWQ